MINAEVSFFAGFTAALTLIFIPLKNVVSDFWGYGDTWGFIHVFVSRRDAEAQRGGDEGYDVASFIIRRKSSRGDSGSLITSFSEDSSNSSST
jgi:hypothetical protein